MKSYDPDNPNADERFIGLANDAISFGLKDDQWFLNRMNELNLYGKKGNKKLEATIYEGLVKKSHIKAIEYAICPFPEPLRPNRVKHKKGTIFGNSVKVIADKIYRGFTISSDVINGLRMIFVADQGAGKTYFLGAFLRDSAFERYKSIFIFELAKKEVVNLTQTFQQAGRTLVIIPYRDLLINFFEVPPLVDPKDWIVSTVQVIRDADEGFPDGALRLLKETINTLYEEHGIYQGSNDYPTLSEVIKKAKTISSTFGQSRLALFTRLEDLREALPQVADVRRGFSISQLEQPSIGVNFQLEGLDFKHQHIIVGDITARIQKTRINTPGSMLSPALVVVEEALSYISKRLENLDKHGHRSRALKIDWIFLAQKGNSLNPAILSFCNFRVTGMLPEDETASVASNWLLTNEQYRWWLKNMRRQLFLMRITGDNKQCPFLFLSSDIKIPDSVPEADKEAGRKFFESIKAQTVIEIENKSKTINVCNSASPPSVLNETEYLLLRYYATIWPALPITEYDKFITLGSKTGIGGGTGNNIRQKFITNGLIDIHLISTGGRVKQFSIPILTQKGLDLLNLDTPHNPINHSIGAEISHTYKYALVAFILQQQGYIVEKDKAFTSLPHKVFVDVSAIKPGGESIAIEVEESLKHGNEAILNNIKKCIALGFMRIYSILPTAQICKRVETDLKPFLNLHPQVKCVTLSFFMEQIPDLWQRIFDFYSSKSKNF